MFSGCKFLSIHRRFFVYRDVGFLLLVRYDAGHEVLSRDFFYSGVGGVRVEGALGFLRFDWIGCQSFLNLF